MTITLEQAFDVLFDDEQFYDLLDRLANSMGAKGYAAGWSGGGQVDSMFAIKNDWSSAMVERYFSDYAGCDPWTIAIMNLPDNGAFHRLSDHVDDATFATSRLCAELLREGGDDTQYAVGNRMALPRGGAGGLTLYRGRGQGDFDGDVTRRLNAMGGDLGRLIALKASMHARNLATSDWRILVDRLAAPMFIVDSSLHLISMNRAADALMLQQPGFAERDGKLRATSASDQSRLERSCLSAAHGSLGDVEALAIRIGDELRHFTVLCAPNPGGGRRIILLGDEPTNLSLNTADLLKKRYRLSPAEAALMVSLASGKSTGTIAEERRVSVETLRTQYRAAMLKMDCRTLTHAILAVREIVAIN